MSAALADTTRSREHYNNLYNWGFVHLCLCALAAVVQTGQFLQHAATFVVGFVIAFTRSWDMTLVLVGCLPFLAGVGGILAKLVTTLTNKATAAYTEVGLLLNTAACGVVGDWCWGAPRVVLQYACMGLAWVVSSPCWSLPYQQGHCRIHRGGFAFQHSSLQGQ
jgi:hypothetical protein